MHRWKSSVEGPFEKLVATVCGKLAPKVIEFVIQSKEPVTKREKAAEKVAVLLRHPLHSRPAAGTRDPREPFNPQPHVRVRAV